ETAEKKQYRVKNWSSYNQALIGRGDITLWFDEGLADVWHHDGPDQQGAQFVYSDECILGLLELKAVFRLGYRQLQGFTNSLLRLVELDLSAPSYSQICRRAQQLDVDIKAPKSKRSMYIVFDATGLKVFGEGEWKVRKHGYSKRRTWRKLHLGVDESTGFIHAQVLTKNGEGDGDSQQFADLLDQVQSPVDRVSGDGAYDTFDIWDLLMLKGIEGHIPPQENAVHQLDRQGNPTDHPRNHILDQIVEKGIKQWKKDSGYHRRSLSETAMFRFKTIYGSELYSRKLGSQKVEAAVKTRCLNKMTAQGMPISKAI
ncbi:unnamed protein product, partial [Discosporangium mesarthrocarpum]